MWVEHSDLAQNTSEVLLIVFKKRRRQRNIKVFPVNTCGHSKTPKVGVLPPSVGNRLEQPLVASPNHFDLSPTGQESLYLDVLPETFGLKQS